MPAAEDLISINYSSRPSIINTILVNNINLGPFTTKVLSILATKDNWGTQIKTCPKEISDLKNEIRNVGRLITDKHKEIYFETGKYPSRKEILEIEPKCELFDKISGLQKQLNIKSKEFNYHEKEISAIRMSVESCTNLFKNETTHFKKKINRSGYSGVGDHFDEGELEINMNSLINYLLSGCKNPSTKKINYPDSPDIQIFKEMKLNSFEKYSPYIKFFENSNLGSVLEFNQRLCHTLLYVSQNSLGSNQIYYDNLGYDNVVVLIKGGQKVYKTGKSKMFRIIHPTNVLLSKFEVGINSSTQNIKLNGKDFAVTPWMFMDEKVLAEGIFIYYRNMLSTLLSTNLREKPYQHFKDTIMTPLLSLHSRRQTEIMLHNLRYILANSTGEYTNMREMLPEFANFNYDYMQCYLRMMLRKNFKDFFIESQKLKDIKKGWIEMKHPFFPEIILKSRHDFAYLLYCKYTMVKAPYEKTTEMMSNAKSILETHKSYLKDFSLETDFDKQLQETRYSILNTDENHLEMDNDFNFDPEFVSNLAQFSSDYLLKKVGRAELFKIFNSVMNESYDNLANSKGLRDDIDMKNYFGGKGYYVTYKHLLKNEDYLKKAEVIHNNELDFADKIKEMSKLNIRYLDLMPKVKLEFVNFNFADKWQWGGKREIILWV